MAESPKLTLSGASFSNLSITPLISADCCEIKIGELTFTPSVSTLIGSDSFNLSVKNLELFIPEEQKTAAENSPSPSISVPKKLPSIRIDFEDLIIHHSSLPAKQIRFTGALSSSPIGIELTGELSNYFATPISVSLEAQNIENQILASGLIVDDSEKLSIKLNLKYDLNKQSGFINLASNQTQLEELEIANFYADLP
ncbi:MAG: hypothetical protein R3A13_12890, partial [Bdellovibrionota bacterium]